MGEKESKYIVVVLLGEFEVLLGGQRIGLFELAIKCPVTVERLVHVCDELPARNIVIEKVLKIDHSLQTRILRSENETNDKKANLPVQKNRPK